MLGFLCAIHCPLCPWLTGKVTRNMQIEQCCVLQAAYEAVEDSGITLQQLHNTTTGVFVAGYCTFLVSRHLPWALSLLPASLS